MTVGRALLFVAALVVWSAFAYAFVFVFAGSHLCNMLQTIPPGGGPIPTPNEEFYAAKAAACNRPDIGAILVFGAGYVALALAAIRTFLQPRSDEAVT